MYSIYRVSAVRERERERERERDRFATKKSANTQRALHGNVVTYYVRRQINRVRESELLIYLLDFFERLWG